MPGMAVSSSGCPLALDKTPEVARGSHLSCRALALRFRVRTLLSSNFDFVENWGVADAENDDKLKSSFLKVYCRTSPNLVRAYPVGRDNKRCAQDVLS